jgi:peptide/nickel transport system permease protein
VIFDLIWRRLFQIIPVAIGVTFIAFGILNLLPGGTAATILGGNATPQAIAQLDKTLGLNHPLVVRYWNWIWAALHGHLGSSLVTQQSVSSIISTRAPVTAELGLMAIIFAMVLALPIATLSAKKSGGMFDRVFTFISLMSISIPPFVVGLGLIIIFALKLRWFSTTGFSPVSAGVGSNIKSLIMPAISLGLFYFAIYLRVLRGDMVQQVNTEHYVVTARGKGVSEWRVLFRHVLPNALFGMITVVTVNLGLLIGGSVLIEQVFSIPGMGYELISAVNSRDAPVVQGIVVCLALTIVLANLLADVLYTVLDPRVRVRHAH